MSDPRDQLNADYDQTTSLIRELTDVRFRLLAFVPTISGAAIAVLGRGRSTAELLAVGLLGLVATLGIVVYELRNTQIYDYAVHRAKELERQLGFVSVFHVTPTGGLFSERPGRSLRIFGLAAAGHDRGLSLVYGAAIGGWSYVVAWGALRALDVGGPQRLGRVARARRGRPAAAGRRNRPDRRSRHRCGVPADGRPAEQGRLWCDRAR